MSSRTVSTKVTLKLMPDELTRGGNRYRLTVADQCHHLFIHRSTQPEAIAIFIESNNTLQKYINCKLVNKCSAKSIVKDFIHVIFRQGWDNFITLEEVLDRNAGWLDCDGCLTLEVTISEPVYNNSIKAQADLVENIVSYAKAVKNLTVCSGDGKEYEINEYLFACHSELLRTHLRNRDNGKVVFTSVPSNFMDEFIFYLENGSINESAEFVAFDLSELAHMYELRSLFDMVEPLLVKHVASGQLSRVMQIAKLFNSKPLYEAIGGITDVSEEHLSEESDDFTVQVHGEKLSISQAFVILKHPHLVKYEDEMTAALEGTSLQAAKGFISFLKTSVLHNLSECVFEYASIASALHLPDLSRLVEQELIANTSKYDLGKVEDLAQTMKSVKIFRALAALP